MLAATKISSTTTRPKIPFANHQEVDQNVHPASVTDPVSSEEQARKELAKKRSINFDSKPPLGASDTFGDAHLVWLLCCAATGH